MAHVCHIHGYRKGGRRAKPPWIVKFLAKKLFS